LTRPNGKLKPDTPEDYSVYVTTTRASIGGYVARLLVVRKTDCKKIFPFDGAPEIGPLPTVEEARQSAFALGGTIVEADLKNPE